MTTSRRLSLLDATFLRIETKETPTHVGGLMVFELPEGAGPRFVHDVVTEFRRPGPLVEPFNLELVRGIASTLLPRMAPAADIDLEYHVRHTVLPAPGGERELGELVSHLHSVLLDRSRPLWTCHVIEGLEGGRFAVYLKIHHALTDGVNGMRLVTSCMADQPDGTWSTPWHGLPRDHRPLKVARPRGSRSSLRSTVSSLSSAATGLAKHRGDARVRLPFQSPDSTLNGSVTAARRVATQNVELARVKAVAERSGTSVNDVFLAICSSALRKHLMDEKALPETSMVAGVPVSLRQEGEAGGNQIGFVWADLGTDEPDTKARLDVIATSMRASKAYLGSMTPEARKVATMATMLPVIGVLLSGLGARVRPPMNVTVSNVPGPSATLYLAGAPMRAIYPVSVPFQGQALNISCLTYDGQLDIGFTGCRDSLPHLQRLAVHARTAFEELEQAFS